MKQLRDAFNHRKVAPPRSVRDFMRRFDHAPRGSVAAMLRKAGPFKVDRDAYRFTNKGWPIWDNNDGVSVPFRNLNLDLRGGQLFVDGGTAKLNDVKGIICEEYTFKLPPTSLRR
jgi:hypothetical protein